MIKAMNFRRCLLLLITIAWFLSSGGTLQAQAFDPTLIEDPEKTEREKREEREKNGGGKVVKRSSVKERAEEQGAGEEPKAHLTSYDDVTK